MTETELIRRASSIAGLRRAPARRLVRALVAEIRRQLMGGYPVTLWSLGTLKVRYRGEKAVQDFNGRRHEVAGRYVVAFTMSPSLRRAFR